MLSVSTSYSHFRWCSVFESSYKGKAGSGGPTRILFTDGMGVVGCSNGFTPRFSFR